MRKKKNKILLYILVAAVISAVVFVATKEISPETITIEKTIDIKK